MNHESLANCEFASLLLPVFYVYIMQLHIIHVNFIHIHYVYSRMFMMYNLHVRTVVHIHTERHMRLHNALWNLAAFAHGAVNHVLNHG